MTEQEEDEVLINHIKSEGWESGGKSEVTIDSAAEESVCPKDWGDMFELIEVVAGKEMKLRNANGGKIEHYGWRDVVFEVDGDVAAMMGMGMGFQTSDVRNPLTAVFRIPDKGNKVQSGPGTYDNFSENVKTKQ